MKTRSELVVAALRLLQADGGAGQSPAPEDMEAVDVLVDPLLADLNERDVFFAQDNQSFEEGTYIPLSRLLANSAAPEFGQAVNDQSRLAAEGMLRAQKPSTYVPGSTLSVEYF